MSQGGFVGHPSTSGPPSDYINVHFLLRHHKENGANSSGGIEYRSSIVTLPHTVIHSEPGSEPGVSTYKWGRLEMGPHQLGRPRASSGVKTALGFRLSASRMVRVSPMQEDGPRTL